MYEIAVCDDCETDRQRLITCINKEKQSDLRIHEFSSALDLLEAMNDIRFAAIFLDIQMRGMDGAKAAIEIRKQDMNLVLVFYTGYAEPSPKTFEVQPYRYIMKNMTDRQVNAYVRASLEKMYEINKMPALIANIYKRQIAVNPKYIVYIEKYKKSSRIHMVMNAYKIYEIEKDVDGKYPDVRLAEPLQEVYEKMKYYGFGCPHASYIINFSYLSACTGKELELAGVMPNCFPIARSKAKVFNEMKERYIRAKYAGKE